jgi:hypothetical protein
MKKVMQIGLVVMAVVAGVIGLATAGDAVEPAKGAVVCVRDEGVAYINATEYYRGTTLLLTNCVVYSGTTTNTPQGLSNVTVTCKFGLSTTNVTFSGTVASAAAGTWWASFSVPTNWEAPYLQVQITDENTNTFIYPWKMVRTKAGM